MLRHINWVAVLVSSFLYTIAGAAWYSPMLFGGMMGAACCKSELPMHLAMLASFCLAAVLAACVNILMEESKSKSLNDVFCTGFVAWLGLVAAPMASGVLWGSMDVMPMVIKSGYVLLGVLLSGAVLVLMKKN